MTPLRLLVYADMRTHHAQSWIAGVRESGIEVRVVSSTAPDRTPTSVEAGGQAGAFTGGTDVAAKLRKAVVDRGLNRWFRGVFGALPGRTDLLQVCDTVLALSRRRRQVDVLAAACDEFRPDVVHALRLPYEGLICAGLVRRRDVPVSVSTWGQDLRYQAPADPLMRWWLRRAVPRFAGAHVDAAGDLDRCKLYGLAPDAPSVFAAGNFGVDTATFFPEVKQPVVLYPRGVRRYVNHRAFLEMARYNTRSGLQFLAVGLERDAEAVRLAADPDVNLRLVPEMPRSEYAPIVRRASVVVSPAYSDGTPNSVLEAIACGALAIAGDIEPVRELRDRGAGEIVLADPADVQQWRIDLRAAVTERVGREAERVAMLPEFDRNLNLTRVATFLRDVVDHHDAGGVADGRY